MADPIILLTYILLGVIIGSALSIIPSLHVYNVAPIFILLAPTLGISDTYLVFFLLGNVIGYSMLNMISTFYFSAPDDTTFMVLMPSQVMLRDGRGIEAVLLGGLGALIVALIFAVISPILLIVIPPLISIIIPNMHWLIALIMFYMLLSEFPKDVGVGKSSITASLAILLTRENKGKIVAEGTPQELLRRYSGRNLEEVFIALAGGGE